MDGNNLMKLASLLGMASRPSKGYRIAEGGKPEVVTAEGAYYPFEKGEVIPLESRQGGGGVSPSLNLNTGITPPDYKNLFSPLMEKEFQGWYSERAKKLGLSPDPDDPRHFYDNRGAWLSGIRTTEGHLPDSYKLPGHPYFSPESIYYQPGMKAGRWEGENYIPLESRKEGGSISPRNSSDTEKEKLSILRDIISVIKPRQGMESRQFGGPVSPDSEPSLMDQIEKTKYDIFKSAMSVLKPQAQKPYNERTSAYGSPPGKSQFAPSLPTPPSLPGLPKPITSSSYGMMPEAFKPNEGEALWQKKRAEAGWENPAEDLWTHKRREAGVLDLTSRSDGGAVIPGGPRIPMEYEDIKPEEDEMDRLRRLLRLGPPTPEGDISARRTLTSTSFPETEELRARERWGTTGYPERRLEEVQKILGPSVLGVQPGFQESYYEAHPEEKLMDEETARMKPLTDAIMKSIEDERTRQQGYGLGFGPTPNELRLGRGRGRETPSQIPELIQGLKGLTPTLVAGGRRGILPTGITTPLSPEGKLAKDLYGKSLGELTPEELKEIREKDITPYQQESLGLRKELGQENLELRKEWLEQSKKFHEENLELRKDLRDINLSLKKRVPANLVKGVSEKTNSLDKYASLIDEFEPNYAGKIVLGPTITGLHERIGTDKERVLWWKNLKALDIQLRHEMFGATLTANEQKAWDAVTVNENSNPNIIRSALRNRLNIAKNALDREIEGYEVAGYEFGRKENRPKGQSEKTKEESDMDRFLK